LRIYREILDRANRAVKDSFGIGKIEAVLCQVGLPFTFVPSEVYPAYSAYGSIYYKPAIRPFQGAGLG